MSISVWADPAVCQAGILATAVIAGLIGFRMFAPPRGLLGKDRLD